MKFTVLGATGFIGSHLVAYLRGLGHEVAAPARGSDALFHDDLGAVFYCIGMTSDFREKPFETVEAHVSVLARVLREARFERLVYLSSTRIYGEGGTHEDALATVRSRSMSDLYNLSKLLGESLCFNCRREGVKVVRLSNIYGADFSSVNFLASLILDALRLGHIELGTTAESGKDYLHVDDALPWLTAILTQGRHDLYNLATGENVSNGELATRIAGLTGATWSVRPEAIHFDFPRIDNARLLAEFAPTFTPLAEKLPELIRLYRDARS